MRPILPLLTALLCVLVAGDREARADDDVLWPRVLERFQHDGGVDYRGLAEDRAELDGYLKSLAGERPAGDSTAEQTAFWINAYNAVVLGRVLDHYPKIESVREVDGFFDELTFLVAGEELTLDAIETRARELGDPRVHFAVVCASAGCPDLLGEPFVAEKLDRQLEEQTRLFLTQSEKGLRFDPETGELWLSSIFKWYAGDFTGGSTVAAFFVRSKVLDWVLTELPPEQRARLKAADPAVRYLDYDWALNDRPR